MVFLQDILRKVFFQSYEVVLPHICQVFTVVSACWLIPGHETFNEPRTNQQISNLSSTSDAIRLFGYLTAVILISLNLSLDITVLTYFLITLTAHALFSRSFLAIKPLQQFSILVAV